MNNLIIKQKVFAEIYKPVKGFKALRILVLSKSNHQKEPVFSVFAKKLLNPIKNVLGSACKPSL